MTRKDFEIIAWNLHLAYERILESTTLESEARYWRQRQADESCIAVADACSGYNPRFNRSKFMIAAGYTHRPDGSMYPRKG